MLESEFHVFTKGLLLSNETTAYHSRTDKVSWDNEELEPANQIWNQYLLHVENEFLS